MSTGDRVWAVAIATLCAINVGVFANTGSPLAAGVAAFNGLCFFALLIDGGRS